GVRLHPESPVCWLEVTAASDCIPEGPRAPDPAPNAHRLADDSRSARAAKKIRSCQSRVNERLFEKLGQRCGPCSSLHRRSSSACPAASRRRGTSQTQNVAI